MLNYTIRQIFIFYAEKFYKAILMYFELLKLDLNLVCLCYSSVKVYFPDATLPTQALVLFPFSLFRISGQTISQPISHPQYSLILSISPPPISRIDQSHRLRLNPSKHGQKHKIRALPSVSGGSQVPNKGSGRCEKRQSGGSRNLRKILGYRKNRILHVGTYNTHTLATDEKIYELEEALKRLIGAFNDEQNSQERGTTNYFQFR